MNRLSKWLWRQNVKNVEDVYELKPGGYYLIEFQSSAVTIKTVQSAEKWLRERNINVLFISNPTSYRAFEPVPATPNQKER